MITILMMMLGITVGVVLLGVGYYTAYKAWFLKEQYLNNRLRKEVGIPTRPYRLRITA